VKKFFTLVELLVVIAIIGILTSILLPSLQTARSKAISALCISNTKQLVIAYTMYSDENKGTFLARNLESGGNIFWIGLIYDFHQSETIIQCPAVQHPVKSSWYWGSKNTAWGGDSGFMKYKGINALGSYGLNGFLYSGNYGAGNADINYFSIGEVDSPSNTPVFTDSIWVDQWPKSSAANPTSLDGTDTSIGRVFMDRHYSKRVNSGQIDGSAKGLSVGKLLYFDWHKNFSYRDIPVP
jgi:prepilin-type N-terminal cleavage/methylation domain-containing protein